jgi:hypothetical protein
MVRVSSVQSAQHLRSHRNADIHGVELAMQNRPGYSKSHLSRFHRGSRLLTTPSGGLPSRRFSSVPGQMFLYCWIAVLGQRALPFPMATVSQRQFPPQVGTP